MNASAAPARDAADNASVATAVSRSGESFPIQGHCEARFAPVLEAFKANFLGNAEDAEELGATACVTLEGRVVVDLWGGFCDAGRRRPWQRDTIVAVRSTTKSLCGIAANMLVDRGQIDLDAPVAAYWPEFAAAGKDRLKVRWLLDHRAGLPVLTEPLWPGAIYDWAAMTGALARQAPLWPPGEEAGYHTFNQGFLVGELVRRVTGQSLGAFVRREIAIPFDIDFHCGLTPEEERRCADFQDVIEGTVYDPSKSPSPFAAQLRAQFPPGLQANTPEWRRSEIPSANGHANARSLARLFAVLLGYGPQKLMSQAALARMTTVQHEMFEKVGRRNIRQGLGTIVNSPPWAYFGPNRRSFGQHGFGGSVIFADPDAGLTVAYAMNMPHRSLSTGTRSQRIIDAAYGALAA